MSYKDDFDDMYHYYLWPHMEWMFFIIFIFGGLLMIDLGQNTWEEFALGFTLLGLFIIANIIFFVILIIKKEEYRQYHSLKNKPEVKRIFFRMVIALHRLLVILICGAFAISLYYSIVERDSYMSLFFVLIGTALGILIIFLWFALGIHMALHKIWFFFTGESESENEIDWEDIMDWEDVERQLE